MAEEVQDVVEEVNTEEAVQPQSEAENNQEAQEQNSPEYNWKAMRESKKQLEREVAELREQMQKLSAPSSPEEPEPELGEDDLVEWKHVKRQIKRLEDRLAQGQVQSDAERLKTKFPDIEEVVSKENLEKLKQSEPEVYASITSAPDLYSRGVSAYKALTGLGIVARDNKREKEQVERNSKKPLSTAAVKGQGPLAQANAFAQGMTPELKKQLQQEMIEAIKGG